MTVQFFWRCEGTTLDATHDYSAGDTTASATGAVSISATAALVGSNGILTVDGNDFYDFDATGINDGTVGAIGFLFRFPSAWPSSGDVFGVSLRNSSSGNNTIQFRGDSTNRFELRIGQAGGSTLDYNLIGGLSTATTYLAVGRFDIANDKRAVEVYSVSGSVSLIEAREDTSTDLSGAAPSGINQIRIGATTYAGVVYIDSVMIADAYDEPLADYALYTSYTQFTPSGGALVLPTYYQRPNTLLRL